MSETAEELRKRALALEREGDRAHAEAAALYKRAEMLKEKGRTRLQNAILDDKKAEAKALIKAGADPNEIGGTDNRPPIILAFTARNDFILSYDTYEKMFSASLVMALIKAGADPNAKTNEGRSVLSLAIFSEKFKIALALLKAGADPNEPEARKYLEKEFADWLNDEDGNKDAVVIAAIHRLLIKKP